MTTRRCPKVLLLRPTSAEPAINRRTALDDLPTFLTVIELMQYLSIGRTAAYDFARQHGVRFGRTLRVPRNTIATLSSMPPTSR
jgi:hypothetical protein